MCATSPHIRVRGGGAYLSIGGVRRATPANRHSKGGVSHVHPGDRARPRAQPRQGLRAPQPLGDGRSYSTTAQTWARTRPGGTPPFQPSGAAQHLPPPSSGGGAPSPSRGPTHDRPLILTDRRPSSFSGAGHGRARRTPSAREPAVSARRSPGCRPGPGRRGARASCAATPRRRAGAGSAGRRREPTGPRPRPSRRPPPGSSGVPYADRGARPQMSHATAPMTGTRMITTSHSHLGRVRARPRGVCSASIRA